MQECKSALTNADCASERSRAKYTRSLPLVALLAIAVSLLGCGGGGSSDAIKTVSITPTSVTVHINEQQYFTATVTLKSSSTTTNASVTWEVNGVAGGNSTVGTIVASSVDALVGIYTAPAAVPTASSGSGEVGQVDVTAVAELTSSTTSVTSNTAVVTVGVGLGLTVTPTAAVVPAGGSQQFSAFLNGVADPAATWSISSVQGGNIGTIGATGLYTAPSSPPPGGTVTITLTDPSVTTPLTATVTVVYSDRSLSGPYAFEYAGNDQSGFLATAGSFVADGAGHIVGGVEDSDSFLNGVSTQVWISGTYIVGADGRGTASINTNLGAVTWDFAITTSQLAEMLRFNSNATGGGMIEQQNVDDLTSSLSAISGPYVFSASGADATLKPMGIAGRFTTDGAGNVPQTNTILDVNDDGNVTRGDTTLQGSYQFDASYPNTGRGILTLTSQATGEHRYAFYIVDGTHLYVLEIDSNGFVAGDAFSAPVGPSFSAENLVSANYVFTGGGNSTAGAYAAGGVFTSNGAGTITGGMIDINNAGTYNNGAAIGSCGYSVDATTGRIDLKLFFGTGACPSGASASVAEFAVYQTSHDMAVMLQIDSNAVATGIAYQQCPPTASVCSSGSLTLASGSFALGLVGQGIFYKSPAAYQQDAGGQITLSGTSVTSGSLDINNFSAVFPADAISTGSIAVPQSNGRGTAVLTLSNPAGTYDLVYYLIDDNTALLFDQDASRVLTGEITKQF